MNPTLKKYNYPKALVREYRHWAVLVRPWQLTLGCMMLIEKSDATAVGQLSEESLREFGLACREIERVLGSCFQNDKVNYVALMMADPNVHFHVIPRYATPREFHGAQFTDTGWPKPPDMTFTQATDPEQLEAIGLYLATAWPNRELGVATSNLN